MEQSVRPVNVICICNAEGEIRPLRLQMEQGRNLLRADVEEIISVREEPRIGVEAYVFTCVVRMGAKRQLLELKYRIRSHSWILMRVVC